MTQLALITDDDGQLWRHVRRNDRRARELADRHYSRQTPGAIDFMASGKTFVLLADFLGARHRGSVDHAVWGAIENMDPAGNRRFRCSIFRNETPWLSSMLVGEATWLTVKRWMRAFAWDGSPTLTTEVDPTKTRRKRDPGRCFRKAGWRVVRVARGLVVLEAPRLDIALALVAAFEALRDRHPQEQLAKERTAQRSLPVGVKP